MREFIYFSSTARTSGNFDTSNLIFAGRMDIAVHVIIGAFYLSMKVRDDVKIHLVFYGMPDPPKHIELSLSPGVSIAKTDVAGMIKRVLYKYKEGEKREVFPGCFVEKKSLQKVVEELSDEGKEIFILDKKGEDIRSAKIPNGCVFILGDQDGILLKEMKRLKQIANSVSIGNRIYFASQVVAVVNNELDRRGI